MANKWTKPAAPPPPLFTGQPERDFVKQINDEVIERVVGQRILYLPLSIEYSDYHQLYGEAIRKTFLPPVHVHALVEFEGNTTVATGYGLDRQQSIMVKFHKRRLTEDQNLFIREGDYIMHGNAFYEIVTLTEDKELFGQPEYRFQIIAKCIQTRRGLIDLEILSSEAQQALLSNASQASEGETTSVPAEEEEEASSGAPTSSGIGASIVYGTPAGPVGTSLSVGESINENGEFSSFFGESGTPNPAITPHTILIFQNGILQSVGNDSGDSTDFYINEDYEIITNYEIPEGDRLTIIALEAIVAAFGS
tara:strand:+ start:3942 stop:4865 length:924 start_codon:yes stop_codon:yes gene_type:complete